VPRKHTVTDRVAMAGSCSRRLGPARQGQYHS